MANFGGYLTEEQIKAIFRNLKSDIHKVFLWSLYDSGRRVSEWLAIRWKDVKWERRLITVGILKKGTTLRMDVPVGRTSIELLKKYVEKAEKGEAKFHNKIDLSPEGLVFPFTRQNAHQVLRRAADNAGIKEIGELKKPFHCHMLRHSRAISLIKEGMQQIDLQKFMAHSSLETTGQYIQYTGDDLRRLRDKFIGME